MLDPDLRESGRLDTQLNFPRARGWDVIDLAATFNPQSLLHLTKD